MTSTPSRTPLVLAAALVAVALLVLWLVRGSGPAPAPPDGTTPPAPVARGDGTPDRQAGGEAPGRTAPPAPTDVAPPPAGAGAPTDEDGWVATGRVRARGGAAVPGASVTVALVPGDGVEVPLGAATTDADGAWRARLPALDERGALQLASALVVARASKSGFQPGEARRAVEDAFAARRVAVDVLVEPGSALRGRAVDAQGRPLPGIAAALGVLGRKGEVTQLVPVGEVRTDAEGRFALGFVSATRYRLLLRADGAGTCARDLDLEAGEDRDLGDLALGGGAPLSGIARYPDGLPAPGLELWAVDGGLAFQPDGLATAVRLAPQVEDSSGLSWSRARTDAQGRFEFAGLHPAHYAIRAPDPEVVLEPRQGRWEPGQHQVEIQVQTPRLVVRAVDGAGRPVAGAVLEATEAVIESDGSIHPGATRRELARGPDATASFHVDPETPLAIRARTRTSSSEERLVFLGQGALHAEETLVLAPRGGTGRVRLVLGDASAGAVTFRAVLASAVTGARADELGTFEAGPDGLLEGVPAGLHRLVVEFGGEGGQWLYPWTSGEAVRVAPDAESSVIVLPRAGARLAVRCELGGPPPPGFDAAQRGRWGVRFVLRGSGATERGLTFLVGGERVNELLPGETGEVEELVDPGDWTLAASGTAWMNASFPVRTLARKRLEAFAEVRAR